jgi:PAT family beta-lactamase induction signal transducer AmpG
MSAPADSLQPSPRAVSAWAVFGNRRIAAILLLGFSSGLPLALTAGTLQAWLTVEGLSVKAIGFATLVGQAYVFKFLWSPAMDRFTVPLWGRWLGRRRGWLLLAQLLLAAALGMMAAVGVPGLDQAAAWPGLVHAAERLGVDAASARAVPLLLLAVAVALFSASQDIVIDAYRTDVLPAEERSAGAAVLVLGYRLAMIVSGGLALWLATDVTGWRGVYALMAALMLLLTAATLWAPRPPAHAAPPRTLRDAVVLPLQEFFSRKGAWLLLLAIVCYKLGDAFAGALSTTFLIRGVGFSPAEVGLMNKSMGLAATLVGALLGGALQARLGLWRALLLFGVLQGASNLAYWALAVSPKSLMSMGAAVGVENLTSGMGTAAFVALLSALCDVRFSATQFALLSALSAVGRVYVGPATGYLVDAMGWPAFYLFTVAAAVPGVVLIYALRDAIMARDGTGVQK